MTQHAFALTLAPAFDGAGALSILPPAPPAPPGQRSGMNRRYCIGSKVRVQTRSASQTSPAFEVIGFIVSTIKGHHYEVRLQNNQLATYPSWELELI